MFLLFSPSAGAAAFPVESLEVKILIDNLGKINVTQKISYPSETSLNWQTFSKTAGLSVYANGQEVNKPDIKVKNNEGGSHISSNVSSKSWEINYISQTDLVRHNDRDQLFLKILDKLDNPVYETSVVFKLPEDIDTQTNLSGNIYTLSGVSNATSKLTSSNSITFSAGYAGAGSLLTVNSSWNKDVLQLTPLNQVQLSLSQLDITPWIFFGVLLPIASLIVLLQLLWRQKKQEELTENISDSPPANTHPTLVGVLVRKKIYAEEIASLIISLCQRGYLIIVKKSGNYFITRRKKADENIEKWEEVIINELFGKDDKVNADNLKPLSDNSLYSPGVRKAFLQIYEVITRNSYFNENPHLTRIKNKLFALSLYYLSAAAIIWVAVSSISPYLIIPLAGTMIVAQLIIKLSVKLANYSKKGLSAREQWLSFNNYLRAAKPLPFEASRNHTFEKYLPYAVAMNSTLNWAKRFDLSSTIIIKPDWFVTYGESSTVEFAKEVAQFTHKISEGVTSLRGPLVS